MNKIYKVMYSKVKQCCVVVSEIAKSHGRHTKRSVAKSSAALTAGVLIALGSFSFEGMPVAQADESAFNNDCIGVNDYYWYWDEKAGKWQQQTYRTGLIGHLPRTGLPNNKGAGAKEPGSIAAGLYAQAGMQTVTIGNRNAGKSSGSVFIGEHSGYDDRGANLPAEASASNNYVTSVGFQSDATGWGSIAIGSNATASNSKMMDNVVKKEGNANATNNERDDTYSIEANPKIEGASVALGYNAHSKDGNIAIGAYSDATDTSSATPYVSVGSSTLKRRITNVADGTGDTDVATVGQMNKAIESIGTTGWNLSTNGNSSSTTITSGKTVDFSPAVDGKNGTTDHKNVEISNDGSKVKISLNKNIVLGEATNGNGGSLNVYSDSTEASNLGNRVSIDGSTVSVNYGKEDGTSGTKRGVVLGVGEDYNNNAQGYIAFNNIDAKGTIGSTYLHSATDAPNDLKGRLVYSNAIDGTEYIANLDDGITFTGDVQKDVPKDYTQTPTKLNTTLNITGGAATEKDLTEGNIGVVSTPAAESADGTTQASKLEIKLNKDLKGITSITSQTTDGTTTSGATITLGTNGTTISGGDVNVSTHKITGLKDGAADTDAATVGQMKTAIGDAKTKYYSVQEGPQIGGFSTNENNDGASASTLAGLAAGYETGTTGIFSTVVGSYSGVIGSWLQGAAAVSVGTVNVNNNTGTSKAFSGVANSIVGQANMTTDSNAAIIVGAGNNVTNSYRDLDPEDALSKITSAVASKDANALKEALQDAVPKSGGQVMVMGGGNNVESAYMSQVVGVGNTVKGNQVYTKDAKTGKWNWTTDTNEKTAIKDYDPKKSSQYNYVDGFNNEVINGKHDYIIGANNKLDGDSYDDNNAKPIKRSNKSNVVIGDNHALTGKKNNVIIGSADTEGTLTRASDAVIIGHNANATSDTGADNAVAIGLSAKAGGGNAVTIGVNTSAGENSITIGSESHAISGSNIAIGRSAQVYGYEITNAVALGQEANAKVADGVAIGSGSEATVTGKSTEGYDPTTGQTSTDTTGTWQATKAAVSIGKADGTVTRQINGVAAGTNDTDAVNVAQLRKLGDNTVQYDLNTQKGKITLAGQDGTTITNVKSALDGAKDANGNIATIATATGDALKNAANLGDLQNVYNDISAKADKASTSHTALTVEGNTPAGKGKDEKTKEDVYAGKNILLHESTDENGKVTYDLKLAQNLTGITSISNQTTGAKIILGTDGATTISGGDVSVSDNKITNIKAGEVKENSKDAVNGDQLYNEQKARTDADTAINNKIGTFDNSKTYNYIDKTASISTNLTTLDTHVKKNAEDISQINTRIDTLDGNAVKYDDSAKSKITLAGSDGTTIDHVKDGTISSTSKEAVNGGQLYNEQKARTDADTAINNKIGTFDNSKTYNYIDKTASISTNLTTLDTHVKKNAEDISQINTRIDTLDGNAVKYDDSAKSKITLAGSDGTTIDHVKDGTISSTSKEAVNGSQLWQVDQKVDKNTTNITKNAGDITNLENLSNITDAGKMVIKNLSKDAVQIKAGTAITVDGKVDETTGNKTYTISANNNGKVAKDDGNLISGGTLYNEVHVDKDGTYIKSKDSATGKDMTVAQNLSALDSGLKTTSDLIHTNTAGDTIQIGGNSTATKIDVNGKDGKGRVITGVVSDANDPNSAANVGYVNGLTAANTQQIYRDMNNAYGRLNNNINKAAAGSNALAALHPLDYDPDDKADFAVGYGHYRNANAAAVGAFYHPNENTMVNVGVSLGNGDPGFNAGVSFKVGRGGAGREAMSKTEMAKVINSQSKEIDALKKDNADKDKRIDALEQKMAEILAKLDKNGK